MITPPAAEGILRSVYAHPYFDWEIRALHVLNPVRISSWTSNELKDKRAGDIRELRTQRQHRILHDVAYVIQADVVLRPEVAGRTDLFAKAMDKTQRRLRKGQAHSQPCFGLREYHAFVELLEEGPLPEALDESGALGAFPLWLEPVVDPRGPVSLVRYEYDQAEDRWVRQVSRGYHQPHLLPDAYVDRGVLTLPPYRSGRALLQPFGTPR